MRAILINAKERTVKEVDIVGDLNSIREHLGCRTIDAPHELENGDTVYCDDEGLDSNIDFIELFSEYDPIPGNILILGHDGEGGNCDCKTSTSDIHNRVQFYDIATLQLKYRLAGG
jgi:hypothetical protein